MYKYIGILLLFCSQCSFAKAGIDQKSKLVAEKIITLLKKDGASNYLVLNELIPLIKNTPFEKFKTELILYKELSRKNPTSFTACSDNGKDSNQDFLNDLFDKAIKEKCVQNIIFTDSLYVTRELTDSSLDKLSTLIKYMDKKSFLHLAKAHKGNLSFGKISLWIQQLLESDSIAASEELINELNIDSSMAGFLFKKLDEKLNISLFKNEIGALSLDLINNKNRNEVKLNTKYFLSYLHQNKDFLNDETVKNTLEKTGKFLIMNQNQDEAKDIFLFSNLNSSLLKDFNSIFYNVLLANLENNKEFLEEIIKKHELVKIFSTLPQKLKYWTAFSLEKNSTESVKLYEKIIEQNPFDFYSIAALDRIKILMGPSYYFSIIREKYLNRLVKINSNLAMSEIENYFKRLQIWLSLGNFSFSSKEVQNILLTIDVKFKENSLPKQHGLFLIERLSKILLENNGLIHLTSNLGRINSITSGQTTSEVIKNSFPEKYIKSISKYGDKKFSFLTLALMRQESAFQENALSTAGAVGLMQVMPKTGNLVQRGITKNKLFDKDINIKIGSKYLKNLIDQYDGNIIYALAAYNAGMSRVNRWSPILEQHKANPLVMMELIPYDETNNYVKYVYRNYFFYNLLYGDLDKLPKISSSFLKL